MSSTDQLPTRQDEEEDEDARRAREHANELARGLNNLSEAVEDQNRSRQAELHNLNDSLDGLRRDVHNGSVQNQPTQFGTLRQCLFLLTKPRWITTVSSLSVLLS